MMSTMTYILCIYFPKQDSIHPKTHYGRRGQSEMAGGGRDHGRFLAPFTYYTMEEFCQ